MKSPLSLLIVLGFLLLSSTACDRPKCVNTNPVFETNQADSKIYKDELAHQLGRVNPENLTFYLKEYAEQDGQEQLHFFVQGDGLCAVLVLRADNWGNLQEVIEKKGVSYRGAGFTHLQFEIQQSEDHTDFVFLDFESIID